MAGQGNPSKPSRVSNFLGRIGDRLVPGNNWNPSAPAGQRWNATTGQYAGAVGGVVGNMVAPGVGTLIRNGVHGATTGNGVFGFLQGNNPNISQTQLTGQPNFQFNPGGFTQSGPLGFDPSGTQAPQTSLPTTTGNPFGSPQGFNPNQAGISNPFGNGTVMGGMAGLTGIGAQMGGARGARTSGGGYTGDAARALFESMTSGPMYFSTYSQQPHNQ